MAEDRHKHWGMVIDLSKCTGCGACVTACASENNVYYQSAEQDAMDRQMKWIRVYRDTEGEHERVGFVPTPCQMCRRPPCTNVCPTKATYLDEEGLVGQIYPRCIGCRYCTVACPYNVKTFNWYESAWEEALLPSMNPRVHMRERGVVEKCTFCYHRLQEARERAAVKGHEVRDEDYTVACQDACPARAIVFGNLANPESAAAKAASDARAFRLLEDLGFEPSVYYLKQDF